MSERPYARINAWKGGWYYCAACGEWRTSCPHASVTYRFFRELRSMAARVRNAMIETFGSSRHVE
ncbi:MAG: hypothetical protein JWM95_4084 [Gemmatimonadetes bacterium]|nr:hypothetical protein [Gemmatimonadota bacterium]